VSGDGGSVSVELTVLAPVVIAMLCLVVGLGRIADADGQVTGAARDAARAASLQRSAAAAQSAAVRAAQTDLSDAGVSCAHVDVTTDTAAFAPGGVVRVTVRCTTSLADLVVAGLPGSKTLTSTAAAPIDSYVGIALGFSNTDASFATNPSLVGAL